MKYFFGWILLQSSLMISLDLLLATFEKSVSINTLGLIVAPFSIVSIAIIAYLLEIIQIINREGN